MEDVLARAEGLAGSCLLAPERTVLPPLAPPQDWGGCCPRCPLGLLGLRCWAGPFSCTRTRCHRCCCRGSRGLSVRQAPEGAARSGPQVPKRKKPQTQKHLLGPGRAGNTWTRLHRPPGQQGERPVRPALESHTSSLCPRARRTRQEPATSPGGSTAEGTCSTGGPGRRPGRPAQCLETRWWGAGGLEGAPFM